jgi:alpha-amylase/alpha-mannosidase (GH57 family)
VVDSKEVVKPVYWANLLHFYQPYGQKREIIDMIVAQCYRPVVQGILAEPRAHVTINFAGVLLDLLAQYGHQDVIDMYAEAARRGQVEFVGSAKYHAILPLLPEAEVLRQIEINDETNRRYLGDAYRRRGIFLPEMAWDPKLAPLLERAGFEWVMLDELAYNGRVNQVDYGKRYEIEGTRLKVYFREHRLSATIMSAAPRDIGRLKEAARDEPERERYILTGMDGETFGHHRIGHERLLLAMFADREIQMVRISDLERHFEAVEKVKTVACTWATSEDDIARGVQFISWNDPTNDVHKLQWELLGLTVEQVRALPESAPEYGRLRGLLDVALSSDPFFWAAGKPWWMIEHIERGAHGFLEILEALPAAQKAAAERGRDLYHTIMDMAYDWQRGGKLEAMAVARQERVRVPLKEATLERGDESTWKAFLDLMRREEQAAAGRADYEAAILWRDALYKLEHKLDIYDAHYVIDLLRTKLPQGEIEETVARYREEYDRIRGGQVEQRSN